MSAICQSCVCQTNASMLSGYCITASRCDRCGRVTDLALIAPLAPKRPDLPEWCYVENPITHKAAIVQRGESGYRPLTDEYATLDVAEANGLLGVTWEQEQAMTAGSMYGWNQPGANPDTYRKKEPTR